MAPRRPLTIPTDETDVALTVGDRTVKLTNLGKKFWVADDITKRDLLRIPTGSRPVRSTTSRGM
jgi:hypothetical protein